MPYRRRFVKRRRVPIRRRFIKRRRYYGPIRFRRLQNRIHNYKCCCELDNFAITAGTGVSTKGYNFSLNQLPNSAEYSTLYDQYRILGIKVTFYPAITQSFLTATIGAQAPGEFYSVIDHDTSNPPASIGAYLQYDTLRRSFFNRPHSRYFRPQCLVKAVMNSDTTATAATNLNRKSWIDMGSMDAKYFGLLVAYSVSDSTTVYAQLIRATATFYFQCKSCR